MKSLGFDGVITAVSVFIGGFVSYNTKVCKRKIAYLEA